MPAERITIDDVRHFTDKLIAFGNDLSPKEQVILKEILISANRDEDDVEGHAIALPFPSQASFGNLREQIQSTLISLLEDLGRTSPHYFFDMPGDFYTPTGMPSTLQNESESVPPTG